MKKVKKFIVSDKVQKVAVDILEDIEAYMMSTNNVPNEIVEIFAKYKKKYELLEDPFTQTICTTKQWAKNSLEYDRQLMMERYGHCDGL